MEVSLQEQLKKLMTENNVSQSRIAGQLGISSAAVSMWLDGTYKGNNTKIAEGVQSLIDFYLEKGPPSQKKNNTKFVKTTNAEAITSLARMARLESELVVCVGEAGYGKTAALTAYAEVDPSSILISANLSYSAKVLFQELHKKTGSGSGKLLIHDMLSDVIERLKGTDRLIIVDQAEYLPHRALDLVREIHDHANIGIMLVGLPRLIENIRGERGQYAQIHSRIGAYLKLKPLKKEDARKIAEEHYPSINGVSDVLWEESKGNCRTLTKLLQRCVRMGNSMKKQIDAEIVHHCAELLRV